MEPGATRFALRIGFEPDTEDPGRVFRAMNQLIDSVQDLDSLLARIVSAEIESRLILDDIQSGSLLSFIRQNVKLDEKTPYKGNNPKSKIEKYLNEANGEFFRLASNNGDSPGIEEIEKMLKDLNQMAKETDVLQLDGYGKVPIAEIINLLKQIGEALKNLNTGDSASYISPESEEIPLNIGFDIEDTSIEDEIIAETITNKNEMILKIKKPDYLGLSQWQFRHRTGSFFAKIEDAGWLDDFQGRGVDVRPGDSLRVILEVTVDYDSGGEVINEDKTVLEVINVIKADDNNDSQHQVEFGDVK